MTLPRSPLHLGSRTAVSPAPAAARVDRHRLHLRKLSKSRACQPGTKRGNFLPCGGARRGGCARRQLPPPETTAAAASTRAGAYDPPPGGLRHMRVPARTVPHFAPRPTFLRAATDVRRGDAPRCARLGAQRRNRPHSPNADEWDSSRPPWPPSPAVRCHGHPQRPPRFEGCSGNCWRRFLLLPPPPSRSPYDPAPPPPTAGGGSQEWQPLRSIPSPGRLLACGSARGRQVRPRRDVARQERPH